MKTGILLFTLVWLINTYPQRQLQIFERNDLISHFNAKNLSDEAQVKKDSLVLDSSEKTDSSDLYLSLGTNFSFVDNFKIKGIYSSIQFFKDKIWNRFGLDILFAQGISSSKDSSSNKDDICSSKIEILSENRNVFLSAMVNYNFGKYVYLAGALEARQNNRKYEIRTYKTYVDTLRLPSVTISSELPALQYQFFAGLGPELFIKNMKYEIKVSLIPNWDLTTWKKNFILRFFFREPNVNIRIGGELRGAFFRKLEKDEQPAHELLLFLSKDFTITKLAQLFN